MDLEILLFNFEAAVLVVDANGALVTGEMGDSLLVVVVDNSMVVGVSNEFGDDALIIVDL